MPYAEPNVFPPLFSDPEEWRSAYAEYVREFSESSKGEVDMLDLQINLRRLGYGGVLLQEEVKYIKAACTR